ncbi:hypothetical protein E6C27_scaffold845G00190 [Cucumis melo var. makuwa]|uniref:Uncharacterized protein n=1 Tax=Cucumis melo var. makuwa TaxID=1194695 RepID=A0A5A7SVM0_CUCMM|nr:hypothetical protein E6C27_scaffold845G00190 [Cucumis melo var. makuwa]
MPDVRYVVAFGRDIDPGVWSGKNGKAYGGIVIRMLLGYDFCRRFSMDRGSTRLICASFGSTRLICASFGITRLIGVSFGITRLICAFYGTTRLLCKGIARGRPTRGRKDA